MFLFTRRYAWKITIFFKISSNICLNFCGMEFLWDVLRYSYMRFETQKIPHSKEFCFLYVIRV